MKKILIINSSAFTIGDIAISNCMVDQVLNVFPDAQIIIESGNPSVHEKYIINKKVDVVQRLYDTRSIIYTPHYFSLSFVANNFKVIVQYILDSLELFLFLCLRRSLSKRKIFKAINEADIIISAGGDAITVHYGFFLRLYTFIILKLMNKKIIIYASTIGPFIGLSGFFTVQCLKKINLILVRDKKSYDFLIKNGVGVNIVKQVADCAITLKQKNTPKIEKVIKDLLITKKSIGIFLKKMLYLSKENSEKYFQDIKDVIIELDNLGYNIIVLSANDTDYIISKRFIRKFQLNNSVVNLMNYQSVENKEILSKFGIIITSRMHPAIFTTTSGVPAIGISSEPKMLEYFKIINVPELCIKPDDVNLILLIDLVTKTIENAEVLERLKIGLINAIGLANKNVEYFNNWVEKENQKI